MPDNMSITVRMYRQGLGDCFLLALPSTTDRPFWIMIDCGVIQGTKNASAEIRRAVKDIIAETDGFVDALVLTHEHWDHVSGFKQAQELFAAPAASASAKAGKLSIGQVWLAWTEDKTNSLARRLGEERERGARSLHGLIDGMDEAGFSASPLYHGLSELMGFFGAARGGTTGAMDFAKSLGQQQPRYWIPQQAPWEDARVPGIRIYALGPPEDERMIKRLYSRKEVYHEFANSALTDSFFAAASQHFGLSLDDGDLDGADRFAPFDRAYGHGFDRWRSSGKPSGNTGRLGDEEVAFFDGRYADSAQDWRRIDQDWLGAAADFALRLDSATNNTSLVLAIEMVDSGRVLLFPADAQVGNWLSWQDLAWTLADGTEVSGPDLLRRTVFYKAGHHGSHNATLKDKGLEQMSTDEFVVFLPVDVAAARKKRWNRMPLPGLVDRMKERAKGRVVQLDSGVNRVDAAVRKDFRSRLRQTDLYFEYRVGD